jgi:hypothetical protein
MEEAVDEDAAYVDALGELDDLDPPASTSSPEARIRSLEDRLEELKRRMGKG